MATKLRLLVNTDCDRSCAGCCNKLWNLKTLPKVTHFDYDEIILTGGEPLLHPDELIGIIRVIRITANGKIFLYTATNDLMSFFRVLPLIDGVVLTLHDNDDVNSAYHIARLVHERIQDYRHVSLRMNIFQEVNIEETLSEKYANDFNSFLKSDWIVKDNIVWIEDCPLPDGEEFKRL